jgi:hypothetical protein
MFARNKVKSFVSECQGVMMTDQEFNELMVENDSFFWMSVNDIITFLYCKGYEREEVISFLERFMDYEEKGGRATKVLLN